MTQFQVGIKIIFQLMENEDEAIDNFLEILKTAPKEQLREIIEVHCYKCP